MVLAVVLELGAVFAGLVVAAFELDFVEVFGLVLLLVGLGLVLLLVVVGLLRLLLVTGERVTLVGRSRVVGSGVATTVAGGQSLLVLIAPRWLSSSIHRPFSSRQPVPCISVGLPSGLTRLRRYSRQGWSGLGNQVRLMVMKPCRPLGASHWVRLPVLAISRMLLSAVDTAGASASALGRGGPAALAWLEGSNNKVSTLMASRAEDRMLGILP